MSSSDHNDIFPRHQPWWRGPAGVFIVLCVGFVLTWIASRYRTNPHLPCGTSGAAALALIIYVGVGIASIVGMIFASGKRWGYTGVLAVAFFAFLINLGVLATAANDGCWPGG